MDIASLIGIIGAMAMIFMAIVTSGGSLLTYVDIPSFLMTVLGSYFALMLNASLSEALGIFKTLGRVFRIQDYKEKDIITKLMAFSDKARREGLLALEEELEDLDDEFMKKGLRLVVDGTDAEIIRVLMETELNQIQGRHAAKIGIVNAWATLAPGLGMIGTVVGLIAMMKNLEDKSAIGPNMAVALITTLYGAIMANVLFIPMAGKLRTHDAMEAQVKEMVIEGVLSIQAGDNPRILGMKLLTYLSPTDRKSVESEILKD
ncbi:motility protein A [Breznakiella homolactica]|uniref:Motility protein A n=1 Tax=Breznakiella homolactica TaxID=2798577 RepID=A0A7T8B9A2_9SPIR|nr:motility protein A [Breznakiella homolactica]QQO08252.1 motility protein A [Breznakiella homolactica]